MRVCSVLVALATTCLLASCAGNVELAAHLRPLPTDTMMLLGKKGMDVQAPIFVRIFKEESELGSGSSATTATSTTSRPIPSAIGPAISGPR